MSTVVYFFKWLLKGIADMGTWLVSVPTIIITSLAGVYTAISTLYSSLFGESENLLSTAISSAQGPLQIMSNALDRMPDIVKVAFYAVSLDVLFRFVIAAFFLFIGGAVLVLEFQLTVILGYYLVLVGTKLTAWFVNMFFPSGMAIQGIKSIASAEAVDIEFKEL